MRCDFKSRNILHSVCLSVFLASWKVLNLVLVVVVVVCFSFSCKVQTVISMIHYLQIMDLMDDPKCYGPKFFLRLLLFSSALLLGDTMTVSDENLLFFREDGGIVYDVCVFTQYL